MFPVIVLLFAEAQPGHQAQHRYQYKDEQAYVLVEKGMMQRYSLSGIVSLVQADHAFFHPSYQQGADGRHDHYIAKRSEVFDTLAGQILLEHFTGTGKQGSKRIQQSFVYMKDGMRYVMQEIMRINGVCVGRLAALRAIIAGIKSRTVFTGDGGHVLKNKPQNRDDK